MPRTIKGQDSLIAYLTTKPFNKTMTPFKNYPVIGSSPRALILDIDGRQVFCSTSNYAYLCMNHDAKWEVTSRCEHEDNKGRWFPETYWVAAYKPQLF